MNDKIRAYQKKYRQDNKQRLAEQNREWYRSKCDKEAKKAYRKKWYQDNKARTSVKTRENKLKRVYGITEEVYRRALELQKYCCAICKAPHSEQHKLRVDHCHRTGNIRGLLCHKCNCGIGMLKDSPDVVEAALIYLRTSHE